MSKENEHACFETACLTELNELMARQSETGEISKYVYNTKLCTVVSLYRSRSTFNVLIRK